MTDNKRIIGLDILRSFAILAVIFYHSIKFLPNIPTLYYALASLGWAGVDLFFVLSGYLIGGQILSKKFQQSRGVKSTIDFWIRRWTRTLPLYWTVLFFYVALKPILFHAPFAGGFNWRWIFFLQNTAPMFDFGQSWSLCIEEQFYFFLPFVAGALLLLRMKSSWIWLLPILMSITLRFLRARHIGTYEMTVLPPAEFVWNFRLPTWMMLDGLSIGIFLAQTHKFWSQWRSSLKRNMGLIGGILLVTVLYIYPEYPHTSFAVSIFYTYLSLAFGLLLIAFEGQQSFIGCKWLQKIALCSYSIYLWHEAFSRLFARLPNHSEFFGEWAIQLVVYLVLVFVFSWASYSWIEKPGLRARTPLLRSLGV